MGCGYVWFLNHEEMHFIILSLIIDKVTLPPISNTLKSVRKSMFFRGRGKKPSFDFSQHLVLSKSLSVLVSLL